MPKRAWLYLGSVLLLATVWSGLAFAVPLPSGAAWITCAVLTVLATCAQLSKVEAPNHQTYFASPIFFFAGIPLLPPALFVPLVTIPLLAEWAKERWCQSPLLQKWYLQPFNIAKNLLSGAAAYWLYQAFQHVPVVSGAWVAPLLMLGGGALYVIVNQLLLGTALVLARGVPWRESGVLDVGNLGTEFVLTCLGVVVAALWEVNTWLILPALSPLVLMYRALTIPQLKQEAQTDGKTGLCNASHFNKLFVAELERAQRFERPMAVIMADLDLLRNINNTYGHLAGDIVLAGIGQVIRKTTREYDIAGRFGGEEFAIVLPETELPEAQQFAERLRQAIAAASFTVRTSPTPISATISIGLACFPQDADTANALIHEADVAVYQAKLQGRNRVVYAANVPHSLKLETTGTPDRLATPYTAGYMGSARPGGPDVVTPLATTSHGISSAEQPPAGLTTPGIQVPSVDATATINLELAETPLSADKSTSTNAHIPVPPRPLLWWFIGGVITVSIALTVFGFVFTTHLDVVALALLMLLAMPAELLKVQLYGQHTFSVSMAVVFAAALVIGLPGVACVSAVIALTHHVHQRRRLDGWYRTAFNWANHVLASIVPILVLRALPVQTTVAALSLLLLPGIVATMAYYAIETSLIATVITLHKRTSFRTTWSQEYQWLAGHYLVLGIMGIFLGVAYLALGMLGVLVFALPVGMMHFAQKQYVARTEHSMRELKRMNAELGLANSEVVDASKAIEHLNHELTARNDELFFMLGKILDARDPYVGGHAAQVADYATAIAMELGLSPARVEQVRQAAFLHDIGKIAISEHILHKPTKLTETEYAYIKRHATIGGDLLAESQTLHHLAPFVRHHHERWDGYGYPDGLCGEQTPIEARILNVCDSVEAMASDRPYHRGLPLTEIIAEVKRCAGTQFDPQVATVFVGLAERGGYAFVVNSALTVSPNQTHLPQPPSYEGFGNQRDFERAPDRSVTTLVANV